ncbi:MAG: DUF6340 family protein [Prolixibacteraceae bacterium]
MNHNKYILLILLAYLFLSACSITDNIRTFNIEILKPSVFSYPEDVDSIAVFKRDFFKSDTCKFIYTNDLSSIMESNIKYSDLSNTCTDALANYLNQQNYFKKVTNYRDSLNFMFLDNQTVKPSNELIRKTKADVCIFLDYFQLNNSFLNNDLNYLYTEARLHWTIAFAKDSSAFIYNQIDTLVFNEEENPEFRLTVKNRNQILINTANYLGEYLGSRLIPSWLKVERIYYKSNNANMLKAEKYALANDWLKAAEIWKNETANKNSKIVAKACFNMALACEMEGKLDLGIDWLVKSYSCLKMDNIIHKENCQRYVKVLALRKKEIERLEKQIRNPEMQ